MIYNDIHTTTIPLSDKILTPEKRLWRSQINILIILGPLYTWAGIFFLGSYSYTGNLERHAKVY